MTAASSTLILAGGACLAASALAISRLTPRSGKPESFWTRTEARAVAAALALVMMAAISIGLLMKGIMA